MNVLGKVLYKCNAYSKGRRTVYVDENKEILHCAAKMVLLIHGSHSCSLC